MEIWIVIYGVFVIPFVTFMFANLAQSLLDHKKELAEIESRTQLAKALTAFSGKTGDREKLCRALLDAYGVMGKDGVTLPMLDLDQPQGGKRDGD